MKNYINLATHKKSKVLKQTSILHTLGAGQFLSSQVPTENGGAKALGFNVVVKVVTVVFKELAVEVEVLAVEVGVLAVDVKVLAIVIKELDVVIKNESLVVDVYAVEVEPPVDAIDGVAEDADEVAPDWSLIAVGGVDDTVDSTALVPLQITVLSIKIYNWVNGLTDLNRLMQ